MEAPLADVEWQNSLVLSARKGEPGTMPKLVSQFYSAVRAYLVRLVGPQEADDLCQEVFLKATTKLDSFDPEYPFGTWLFRIASNSARDFFRRRGVRRPILPEPTSEPYVVSPEESENLSRALQNLPPDLAEPLLLFYQQGKTHAEVAQLLGLSVGAAKMRVHRAIGYLRALLKQGGRL
jgi:RNA polymerase sigma factor (sigma-70 family)